MDAGSGAIGYISSMDVFSFGHSNSLLFKWQEARGLHSVSAVSWKVHTTWTFEEHLMASLMKALRQCLFLLGKTMRNKKASEFNNDTLRGLTDQGPRGSPREVYPDGPWDGPRSVEGHEIRWRGLQTISEQLSWLTIKPRFCNGTRTLLL